ncbi:MAG: class I SAM-dependent methyltransferase [Minisyncoccia bacterium]
MTWHDNYFNEEYIDFYRDILTPERTEKEVAFLLSILSTDTKRILDMPCGYGRHSIELARKGYQVHGVDFYDSQLRVAIGNAEGLKNITFEKADMREYVGKDYDAVLSMFSSFGYFSREEDFKVLSNMVSSARPGGLIVLDVRNPVRLRNALAESNWELKRETHDGSETDSFDPVKNTHSVVYDRKGVRKRAVMNIYMPDELEEAFTSNDCTIAATYGGYDSAAYESSSSNRLIIVARRNA